MTIRLNAIGQLSVNVHDLERAVTFYRDTLGLTFLFQAPPNLAFFDCAGVRLMLATPDKPEFDHPSSIIYFRVEDIRGAHQDLATQGVAFEGEPLMVHKADNHELWLASFRDTEGNLLALMSETAAS